MTIFKYLRILLLSLYWQMPTRKEGELVPTGQITREQRRKEIRKKRRRKERQVSPTRLKKTFPSQNFRSTKAKDPRFSDQRKLRRMYRGV